MKKYIGIMIMLSVVSLGDSVKFETLDDNKKDMINTINKFKNLQMDALNYELTSFEKSATKTSGENIIDDIEDEINKRSVVNKTYFMGRNKENYILNSKILFENMLLFEGNSLNIGLGIGYQNGAIDNNKLNGVNASIKLNTNIADYNIDLITEHQFSYTGIKYHKKFNQNYLAAIGALVIKTNIGEKFYVQPGIRVAYNYNLKSDIKDQNDDIQKLLPSVNASVGAFARLGYNFKGNNKISIGYALDKRIKNKNNFEIFSKKVDIKENNYITHDVDARLEINMKEKHNIITSIGYINKNIKCGISYNYSW